MDAVSLILWEGDTFIEVKFDSLTNSILRFFKKNYKTQWKIWVGETKLLTHNTDVNSWFIHLKFHMNLHPSNYQIPFNNENSFIPQLINRESIREYEIIPHFLNTLGI